MLTIKPRADGYDPVQFVNCSRCGSDFESYYWGKMKAKICHSCRLPKSAPQIRGTKAELLGQPFTVRELQILSLVCDGLLNKEIAHILHLAVGTVKVFLSTVLAKAGKSNRTALAMWCVQENVLD